MRDQELEAVHRQAVADGMVKIGIQIGEEYGGVEWCYAHRISTRHARIDNVPAFCDEVNYGDVVQFREQDPPHLLFKEFVRVKTRGSHSLPFRFVSEEVARTLTEEELRDRARRMREYLNTATGDIKPLAVEVIGNGWMVGAWPVTADADAVCSFVDSFAG